jgi:hypothetical protein
MMAPLMLNGAINRDAFLAYVERFLAPTLAPGDIVVADNLASRNLAGVRQASKRAMPAYGSLPAYSPDLNPTEQGFSKIKAQLRKVGVPDSNLTNDSTGFQKANGWSLATASRNSYVSSSCRCGADDAARVRQKGACPATD